MTPVQPSQQEELSPTQPDPDYSQYWEEDRRRRQQLKAAGIVPESAYDGLKPRDTQETLNDYAGGISLDEDGEEIIPDSQGEEDYILVRPSLFLGFLPSSCQSSHILGLQ